MGANFNFNKVILGGRLTSDVEVKTTQSGISVANFSIAVNRRASKDGEKQVDFINCQAWRSNAELIGKYFSKGSSICIVGSLQVRSWEDNNGNKRYDTEVIVDEVAFVDSKNDAQGTGTATPTNYIPDAYNVAPKGDFEAVETDDSLPF
jgi:single-strand DNA-binding protein